MERVTFIHSKQPAREEPTGSCMYEMAAQGGHIRMGPRELVQVIWQLDGEVT